MTKLQFPNESDEYRRSRATLLEEEIALRQRITDVAELRAQLPAGGRVKQDYEFDEIDKDGDQMPMANVFVRRDGGIRHFWGSEMLYADIDGQARHIDLMWPLWNVFDTTPEGRGTDWYPALAR